MLLWKPDAGASEIPARRCDRVHELQHRRVAAKYPVTTANFKTVCFAIWRGQRESLRLAGPNIIKRENAPRINYGLIKRQAGYIAPRQSSNPPAEDSVLH